MSIARQYGLETGHLLKSPANAKRLKASIADANAGKAVTLIQPIKSNTLENIVNALPAERKANVEKRTAELVAKEHKRRGRPPAPSGVTKDRAAYMRARRAKKDV